MAHHVFLAQDLDDASDRDKFQSTTGPMMECIMHSLNVGEEGSAQEALEMFIEVRVKPCQCPHGHVHEQPGEDVMT